MTQENSCIFCKGPLSDSDVCSWCGFSQQGKADIPGTLAYGTKVDIYIVGDVITMDGESSSYSAYDTQSRRKVILKEFLPVSMVAPRDGDTVKVQPGKEVLFKNLMMDFTDLYTALGKIDSKALQKVYRIFHANGTVYTVLESVKGDTLRQNLIKKGKHYTFKEARWLFQDLFVLMKQLEENNIAHGGISDETVMITTENNAVLTGFAIQDLRVKNEHIIYKLYDGFSAPEQYITNRFPGFYTDIFSVAVLFYYSITGKTYTDGMFETKEVSRHIPKYAVEALKHATQPDPRARIDNIEDFVLMLDNKAVVEKPSKKRTSKNYNFNFNKKYILYITVIIILIVFAIAVFSLSNTGGETLSSSEVISSELNSGIPVPDFRGKSYSEIMNDEEYTKYFYFHIEEEYSTEYRLGQVISHSPAAGQEVEQGTLIYLTVSKGEPMITVPDGLVGLDISTVEQILENLGIKFVVLEKVQTEQYPYNTVQGTDKMPGTSINPAREFLVVYVSDNTPLNKPSPSPSPTPTPTPDPTPDGEQPDSSETRTEPESEPTE